MRKKLISGLQYLIFLGLGVFLIWWQLRGMTAEGKEQFFNSLKNANYWLMPVIVVIALLSHLARCLRWKILLEPMGYNPRISNMFCATMIGYLANSAVPRLGEVLKCTFLSRYEKLPVDKLFGTIVIERVFDLISFLIFILFTLTIQWGAVSSYFQDNAGSMKGFNWTKLFIILGIIAVSILLIRWLFKRYKENAVIKKIAHFGSGIKEGLLTIRTLKRKKMFLFHTFSIWALYLLQVYIGFSAMEHTAHLGIGPACAVLVLASLAMIITPGGIGAFPFAIMKVLLLYNIAAPQGQSFGWLMWGVSTGIVVVTGFICLLILPYINKKKKVETA
ncbi:MAG: lysylphosphatidylglycerol synthase transmembrane domain-containing protein [Bacteroidota bacterium]